MYEDSELNQPPREKGDNKLIVRWLENFSTYFLQLFLNAQKYAKNKGYNNHCINILSTTCV